MGLYSGKGPGVKPDTSSWLRLRKRGFVVWTLRCSPSSWWWQVPCRQGAPEVVEDEYMAGYLRRRESGAVGKTPATARTLPEDREAYPALLEFVTATAWEDGTERRPGTLLLFVDEGRLKVCLSDRSQEQVLFLTVSGLFTMLEEVDDALRQDDADWRPARKERSRR